MVGAPNEVGGEALLGGPELTGRPGDRVTYVDASLHGLTPGAYVAFYALPGDGLGAGSHQLDLGDGRTFDDLAKPLAGYTFESTDGVVQIVVGLGSETPGVYSYDGIALQFRVNSGPVQEQVFGRAGMVCVGQQQEPCARP
jgi:hypothetical protein